MDEKNKFSSMIINGQIVDLNSIPYKKMDEIQEELEKEQTKIRERIDRILYDN